jgi:hypothetical protein
VSCPFERFQPAVLYKGHSRELDNNPLFKLIMDFNGDFLEKEIAPM